ncbi:hypothetical protein TWF569_002068 [Orbilia oligospora]|nr:hypothetical protein TWF569_002068 [Orbilia oligospora]
MKPIHMYICKTRSYTITGSLSIRLVVGYVIPQFETDISIDSWGSFERRSEIKRYLDPAACFLQISPGTNHISPLHPFRCLPTDQIIQFYYATVDVSAAVQGRGGVVRPDFFPMEKKNLVYIPLRYLPPSLRNIIGY